MISKPSLPLFEKRILVTRGKQQAKEFSQKIREAGGIPLEFPLIAFQVSKNKAELEQVISELTTYNWIIFTSKNGVDFFFQAYEKVVDKPPGFPKTVAVGTKTELALKKYERLPDLIPNEFVAEGIVNALAPKLAAGDKVLLVRGNLSRSLIKDELSKTGAAINDVIVYETVENTSEKARLLTLLETNSIDVLTFTSPSTVNSFLSLVAEMDKEKWMRHMVIACIGPITKQALVDAGIGVHVCPDIYTTDAMLQALISYYRGHTKEEI